MGNKVTCNPLKLASIVRHLQRTRTAHTIKDLEKALPSVASINSMQVKDYIQSLQDENKIRVEKIGSGNWYWNFASEDKKVREKALEDAQTAHRKACSTVDELKTKLAEAQAQREDEADMLDGGCESREELMDAKRALEKEVAKLQKKVAAYAETDPTEIERKREETTKSMADARQHTDDIESMAAWFRKTAGEEAVGQLAQMFYGDEMDDESGCLKEI